MIKLTKTKLNQSGMVSIIVTLVLMIIVTLVVLGFAQISRREQRQALDRQLSTQAFYAAESGINDAIKVINSGSFKGLDKLNCDNTGTPFSGMDQIDPADNVSYTCLLVNQGSVPNLVYKIDTNNSISANLTFKDPTTRAPASVSDLTIKWDTSTSSSYPIFPQTASWSLLRMTVTDLSLGFPRNTLDQNSYTAFLYPSSVGSAASRRTVFSNGSSVAGLNAQGKIVKAKCSAGSCVAVLHFNSPSPNIFLHLTDIYATANNVVITATSGGSPIDISGAQAIIDSTGKAQDVYRRIQVRLPLNPSPDLPSNFTVQSVDGICKQLQVNSTTATDGC